MTAAVNDCSRILHKLCLAACHTYDERPENSQAVMFVSKRGTGKCLTDILPNLRKRFNADRHSDYAVRDA